MTPTNQKQKSFPEKQSCSLTPLSHQKSCAHCGRIQVAQVQTGKQKGCQSVLGENSSIAPPLLWFCCPGCEQVHNFLKNGDLTKYYSILKSVAKNAPEQSHAAFGEIKNYDELTIKALFEKNVGEFVLFIPSLSCAACIWLIEKSLSELSDVQSVAVNLLESTVVVKAKSEKMSLTQVCQTLRKMGYQAFPPQASGWNDNQKGLNRKTAQNIAISGALFGNIMLFSIGTYFGDIWGMDEKMRRFFVILMFLMGSLSLLYPGSAFLKSAWNSFCIRKLNIDIPISIALLITYITSVSGMLKNSNLVYFDSLSGLIFLLLSARAINEYLLQRARRLTNYATSLLPQKAFELKPGQQIWVTAGEHFPADGTIVEGKTDANEAAVTGESKFIFKELGSKVFAGTQNISAPVFINVERCGADTFVGKLINLVQTAREQKSNFQILSEKILPYFLMFTLISAFIASFLWIFLDPNKAPSVLATVLIVACPCAIALAVPLTLAFALNTTWKNGFVIKGAQILERLCCVNTLIIDKTGTLTTGKFTVIKSSIMQDKSQYHAELMSAALCLASRSKHPVSNAVAEYIQQNKPFNIEFKDWSSEKIECFEDPGIGMRGHFPGVGEVRLGKAKTTQNTMTLSNSKLPETTVFLSCNNREFSFSLQDTLRIGSVEFLNFFIAKKFNINIATGDNPTAAENFKHILKIAGVETDKIHWHCELKPSDKLNLIETLKQSDSQIVMIGDGFNDAPALARADVGVAMGGGIDIALNAAEVLFLNKNMFSFVSLYKYALHTQQTLKIVIALSVLYNLTAVILACFGILHPIIAALIMPISSITTALIVFLRKGDSLWKSCIGSSPSQFYSQEEALGPF